jgi:hypothetical protein
MKTPHLLLALPLLAALVGCHREDSPAIRARAAAVGVHPLITSVDLAGADLAGADLAEPPPDLLPTQIPYQQPRNGTCLRQQWLLFSDGTVKVATGGETWFDACREYYCYLTAGRCSPRAYSVFYTDSGCTIARQLVSNADDGLGLNPITGAAAKFLGPDGRYYTRGGSAAVPATGATAYYRTSGGVCNSYKFYTTGVVAFVATVATSPASAAVSYTSTYETAP